MRTSRPFSWRTVTGSSRCGVGGPGKGPRDDLAVNHVLNLLILPIRRTRYRGRVSQIRLIAIRDTALSVDEVRAAIADPAAGGEVLFVGTVRDNDADKGVTGLSYSAHPSAEKELLRVAAEIADKYPDAIAVAAVHRIGDLNVGDLAVVVGVSCAHRAEAFHACHALIDELKATVPVWKHQRFADGTDEWVGSA
jgi:molybdopterin synthase catalytic subunit